VAFYWTSDKLFLLLTKYSKRKIQKSHFSKIRMFYFCILV